MKKEGQIALTLTDGASQNINADESIINIRLSGNATISTNYSLNNTGTNVNKGSSVVVQYVANATYNGGTVTIFGRVLTQQEAKSKLVIIYMATGSDYDVFVIPVSDNTQDRFKGTEIRDVTLTGVTETLNPVNNDSIQILNGTGTLTGNYALDGATAKEGDMFFVSYQATLTPGIYGVTILGVVLTTDQITNGGVLVIGYYDGSDWNGILVTSQSLQKVSEAEMQTSTDNDKYVTSLRVAQKLAHWLLNTNKSTSVTWTFSSSTPITLSGLTASTILELDSNKNIISATKVDAYNKPFGVAANTVMQGNDTRVTVDYFDYWLSFEAGEIGQLDVVVSQSYTITEVKITVVGALAATDAGLFEMEKNGLALTGGSQSIPALTAYGIGYVLIPSTNNDFTSGDTLSLITSKTTAGGRIFVRIKVTRTT